jgi:AcrR family transcriptional regulator
VRTAVAGTDRPDRVEIADEEGLAAVSIRRIAQELRSGAMSLYHYFDSRDELLDLMSDTVAGEMLVPGEMPADWREALRAIAQYSRQTFRAHPWMLMTLQDRPRVSPNLLRHIEQSAQSVASLGEAGVDRALLEGIVTATDDYTIGYTLRELAAGGVDDDRGRRMAARFAESFEAAPIVSIAPWPSSSPRSSAASPSIRPPTATRRRGRSPSSRPTSRRIRRSRP